MFRVVLIDDEALVLKGMSMVLEKDENIQLVGTASTGPEGFDLIYKEKPDIVFTDIRMPGMTGLEMIRHRKDSRRLSILFSVDLMSLNMYRKL